MLVPVIQTRMKERNHFVTDRIKGVGLVVFDVVASLTGKREIVGSACATLFFREDMFKRMLLRRMRIGTNAVFAEAPRTIFDQSLQLLGDALFSHAAQA